METSVNKHGTSSVIVAIDETTTETDVGTPASQQQPKEHFWIDSRYFVIKFLGEGAFGAVFLVYDDTTHQYLALKMPKDKHQQSIFQREIHIMQRLEECPRSDSKPLAHLRGYSIDRGVMVSSKNEVFANDVSYFVTEFANNGDLASEVIDNVDKYKQGIPEKEVFTIFSQLIEGLEYIHEQGFVHLDLKPDNILLYDNNRVAISDFALAKSIKGEDSQGNFFKYRAGARQYWSPEMFARLPYNGAQSDLYALGVTLFIITFGCCPFNEATLEDGHFRKMIQNPVDFWKCHPETAKRISENTVSQELVKLLNFMLCPFPQYRLSLDQIKQQQWFVDNCKPVDCSILGQNLRSGSVAPAMDLTESDISSIEDAGEASGEEDIVC